MNRLTDGEADEWEEGQTGRPESIGPSSSAGGPINKYDIAFYFAESDTASQGFSLSLKFCNSEHCYY